MRILYVVLMIFFGLMILACGSKSTQKAMTKVSQIEQRKDTIVEYLFPEDWLGIWSGTLEIYNQKGVTQSLEMGLEIEKTDTVDVYDWTIIYGSDSTAQRREYQLIAIDTSKGHYMIDEKNGIFLDGYHMHDAFVSVFEVMDNTLVIAYERNMQEMNFTVDVFPSQEIGISGDTLINGQEIPEVKSFQYTGRQRAVLNKKCLVE